MPLKQTETMYGPYYPLQSNCVPQWTIMDNLFLIRDLIDLSKFQDLDFGLFSIDQEKSFDRVGHKYLLKTLEAFGFGLLLFPASNCCTPRQVLLLVEDSADLSLCTEASGRDAPYQECYMLLPLSRLYSSLVDKVSARLFRWAWIQPQLSYMGRALVVNYLATLMLWHRLIRPAALIANIQKMLVKFYWGGYH